MPDQLGKKGEGFRRFFTAFTRLLCGRKLAVNPNCRTRQRGDDKSIETIVARRSIESDRNEIVGVGGAVRALERELVPLLFLRDSSTTKFSENNLSLVFSYFSSYTRKELLEEGQGKQRSLAGDGSPKKLSEKKGTKRHRVVILPICALAAISISPLQAVLTRLTSFERRQIGSALTPSSPELKK